MCISLVSFGDFGFYFDLCGILHRLLAIVFGHIHDGVMSGLRDGEAACFRLISLFLSVCWLEKFMLLHLLLY